jgi:GMP reductase
MREYLFSYDDIYLRPRHSSLLSRSDADVSVEFLGNRWKLPVIPANMEDVIDRKIAEYLSANDYFYIYHRFGKKDTTHCFVGNANLNKWKLISVAIGVDDRWIDILTDIKYDGLRIDVATIDIAHADHENVKKMISFVREKFPNTKIIVGNVATAEGYKYLCDMGVDAVKVGIGGGKICTTKHKTGFHIPTFQSVLECAELGLDTPIIADGGIKYNGDIAKALVAGATLVMCGGLFASCLDSPAKIVNGRKIYRGSTSYESKGERRHIEGITLELEEGFTYAERLQEIKEDLSSAVSYAGGKDLSCFNSVKWGIIRA